MGLLKNQDVYHCLPLHYLPFIARSKVLLSKLELLKSGFQEKHFRSSSFERDIKQNFASSIHLTLNKELPLLRQKLKNGFPHLCVIIPGDNMNLVDHELCRYNIGKHRFPQNDEGFRFLESAENGRCLEKHRLPTASEHDDKIAMLQRYGSKIEVPVHNAFPLPDKTQIECYSKVDEVIVQNILKKTETSWSVRILPLPEYNRKDACAKRVEIFIEHALADPDWRGDGLEFDNFKTCK